MSRKASDTLKSSMTTNVPIALRAMVNELSREKGVSISEIMERAIELYVEQEKPGRLAEFKKLLEGI